MTSLRNFTLLQTVINNYPEFNCVTLKCLGSGSICYNLLGNSDHTADHCFCEFPFYGAHCEYDETDILKASLKIKYSEVDCGGKKSLPFRDFVVFQFFVCLIVVLFYFWRSNVEIKKKKETKAIVQGELSRVRSIGRKMVRRASFGVFGNGYGTYATIGGRRLSMQSNARIEI